MNLSRQLTAGKGLAMIALIFSAIAVVLSIVRAAFATGYADLPARVNIDSFWILTTGAAGAFFGIVAFICTVVRRALISLAPQAASIFDNRSNEWQFTLLTAIAACSLFAGTFPNLRPFRFTAREDCINNLRILDGAKQQWALDHRKLATETPTKLELSPYLERSGKELVCPANGKYSINSLSNPPTCSIKNHVLPQR